MNVIVNKFLLVEDKFMPEMHLKQPGFTYSTCGPFSKNKEGIEKFVQTGNADYIYKNDLDKACFQHKLAYNEYKDKVLRNKAFEIASNPKYECYQRGSASIACTIFDKKSTGNGVVSNHQLENELHKRIIRKFQRRIVYSSFKDNILGVNLADMQLISKYNTNTEELGIYFVLLIFLANMYGLLLQKTKKAFLLLMHFKVF